MKSKNLIVGLALAALIVPMASAPDTGPVDELKEYRVKPKYFDTYPPGSFQAVGLRCYEATGNMAACICALWNLEEAVTYDEAKAAPGGPGALLDVLYTACEAKHPAPLPTGIKT